MAKMLYVEWVDSMSESNGGVWIGEDKAHAKDLKCSSVGFVVAEDRKSLTLAGHLATPGKAVSGNITIPKCAITKRRRVSVKP